MQEAGHVTRPRQAAGQSRIDGEIFSAQTGARKLQVQELTYLPL